MPKKGDKGKKKEEGFESGDEEERQLNLKMKKLMVGENLV